LIYAIGPVYIQVEALQDVLSVEVMFSTGAPGTLFKTTLFDGEEAQSSAFVTVKV
jgi:hypothetical protein